MKDGLWRGGQPRGHQVPSFKERKENEEQLPVSVVRL